MGTILERYIQKFQKSGELYQEALSVMPGGDPFLPPHPFLVLAFQTPVQHVRKAAQCELVTEIAVPAK